MRRATRARAARRARRRRRATPPYTFSELDFYSCLTLLDGAVGRVLDTLEVAGYRDDTMVWFTTDNGPEVNCHPEGICEGAPHRPTAAPGSAGPLRGRKRDIWEGGHRVPGIVAWPAVVGDRNLESWTTVGTFDFLPTVMEVLGVVAARRAGGLGGRRHLDPAGAPR